MSPVPPLYFESPRGQCAVMLLAALRDMYLNEGRRRVTKRQTVAYIGQNHWFAIEPHDNEPYPSNRFQSNEPRWHTLIAWARKDCVIHQMVTDEGRDMWGLTRLGRGVIDGAQTKCKDGNLPISACFLWSVEFKRFMLPGYVPGVADKVRPTSFYRDVEMQIFEDLYT